MKNRKQTQGKSGFAKKDRSGFKAAPKKSASSRVARKRSDDGERGSKKRNTSSPAARTRRSDETTGSKGPGYGMKRGKAGSSFKSEAPRKRATGGKRDAENNSGFERGKPAGRFASKGFEKKNESRDFERKPAGSRFGSKGFDNNKREDGDFVKTSRGRAGAKNFGDKREDRDFKSTTSRSRTGAKSFGDKRENRDFEKAPSRNRTAANDFGNNREDRDFKRTPSRSRTGAKSYDDKRESDFERTPARDRTEGKSFEKRTGERSFERKPSVRSVKNTAEKVTKRYAEKQQEIRDVAAKRSPRGMKDDKPAEKKGYKKSYEKRRKFQEAQENNVEEEMRLNRYVSNAGVSSRREADELIQAGLVSVNGEIVTELGVRVKPGDVVRFNGERLSGDRKVYIIMNKPKDTITTLDDPDKRRIVTDLLLGHGLPRVYPIGRLDRNTTGVLVLTNDGELSQRLMHPKFGVQKVYKATLNKNFKGEDIRTLSNGIELEDGFIKPDSVGFADAADKKEILVELHSGKNHIVHRMFEHLGYFLERLDRIVYAGFNKKSLKRGEWREMDEREVKALKKSVQL